MRGNPGWEKKAARVKTVRGGRKWLLVVFCVLCIVQEAATIVGTIRYVGYTGAYATGRVAPFRWRLMVLDGYAAAEAGVRDGDVLDARRLTAASRFRLWSYAPLAGQREFFPLLRNGASRTIVVPVAHTPFPWPLWIAIAAGFWSALCALVLVWRRPESKQVAMLVLYLLLVRLSIQMSPANFVTPFAEMDLCFALLGAIAPVGWAILASYAASFVPSSNRLVLALKRASWLLAAYIALIGVAATAGSWFGFIDPEGPLFAGPLYVIAQAAYMIAPLACAIVALRAMRGEERLRLTWLLAPTAVIYLIFLSYQFSTFVPALNSDVFTTASLILQLLAPLGITYAMLNRRLLDIGFVLNRAAVYAGVSIVIVGTFVLLEWAFAEWFSSATHAQNLVASGAIALLLGLSIRAIHYRVDLILDSVFFKKRHDDERSLRLFAREAPYITDAETLLRRTTEAIERHADTSSVTFALYDGSGRYGEVDENDPALVSIRAQHRIVDLTTVKSALPGEFVYPMVARGRVVGAMVLGPKRTEEPYAPDETAAIEQVAHSVAGALDVLQLKSASSERAMPDALAAIAAALERNTARLDEIVEQVSHRGNTA